MADKFNDIKVGDNVFVTRRVEYGWRNYKKFLVSKKVTRTTPKQFLLGVDRYRKSDGALFCSGSYFVYAKKEGIDQTKECNSFIRKIKLETAINDIAKTINIPLNSKGDNDTLSNLLSKLEGIKKDIDILK